MSSPEFVAFRKIPRLTRGCVITEKIDGTNASVLISEDPAGFILGSGRQVPFMVGSRSRWIFPDQDNMGFAKWAYENADALKTLGPGHHFGEWWGSKIQRGYGLVNGEKRFSLFNVHRWADDERGRWPANMTTVPVLYRGVFSDEAVAEVLMRLRLDGSVAAPGFMNPEGIIIWHEASRAYFKKTLENDEVAKGGGE